MLGLLYYQSPNATSIIKQLIRNDWGIVAMNNSHSTAELVELSYKEYLKSPEWKIVRARITSRDLYRCRLCNRGPEQGISIDVHHRKYDIHRNDDDSDLITLCCDCHEMFHRYTTAVHHQKLKPPMPVLTKAQEKKLRQKRGKSLKQLSRKFVEANRQAKRYKKLLWHIAKKYGLLESGIEGTVQDKIDKYCDLWEQKLRHPI